MPGLLAVNVAVVLLVTALGLRTRPADTLLLLREPPLGARAVMAMFVFVPVCTLLMTWILPLEPAIRASLLAMSVAPLCPILSKAVTRTDTDGDYMFGLQIFAAAASIVAVPLMLAISERVFDFGTRYPIGEIVFVIVRQIGIPLLVGMGLAMVLGDRGDRVAVWLERIGQVTLISGMVLVSCLRPPQGLVHGSQRTFSHGGCLHRRCGGGWTFVWRTGQGYPRQPDRGQPPASSGDLLCDRDNGSAR